MPESKAKLSVYNCLYHSNNDGDTFRCIGDVSPVVPDSTPSGWVPKVRLLEVDAPERGQTGWAEASTALRDWLEQGPFNLICYGRDKYGRLLADAERGEGLLSGHLLAMEVAQPMSAEQRMELLGAA